VSQGAAQAEPLAVGTAPGKLILFGEHAVVHGHPAIAAAVGLRSRVSLYAGRGATRIRHSSFHDERLRRAVAQALPAEGLAVDISSDLPPGRGMGSSASIAVAMVRAAAAFAGERLDRATLFERSFELERIFHGQPSGVDNSVVIRGGLLRYRKGPPLELTPLRLARPLHLVVLDSGCAGSTAELVAQVQRARPGVDSVLASIGALVERACEQLDDPSALGGIMDENHRLLRALGVSTPDLDEICGMARDAGALGAKLSGAGGGGVAIALVTPDGAPALLEAARGRGIGAFDIQLPCDPTSELP
jgi:mevalonate kinase